MRLVFLSSDFKPRLGGIAELSYQICRELAQRGHELHVLTHADQSNQICPSDQNPFSRHIVVGEYPVRGMRSLIGFWQVAAWRRRVIRDVRNAVLELKPDLVLAGNYNALWPKILGVGGVPYCIFLHGEDLRFGIVGRLLSRRRRMARCLHSAAHLFFNSSYSASLLAGVCRIPDANVTILGAGFPADRIVTEERRRLARRQLGWSDEPVILTVARLIMRKGIDTVIHSLPAIRRQHPNCRYVIVGDGPDRADLERLAGQENVADCTQFLGRVSDERKELLYAASDLYVMPSRPGPVGEVEGFGISFLEANAFGLAVIGSTAGGIPDAVEHGANGLLVPPSSPTELAEAVITLLGDPVRRQAMARTGQERIRTRYNWKSIVDRMEPVLKSCVRESQ